MADRILSASAALAEALHEEMARDETVFILGEDLTAHAGIFGQFKGIPETFPGRILDTPISEACIAGCGVGAALTGMRPIVDFHFADFVTCGMDEFCNQAAKIRYMFGGQVKLPMVVWCPDGAGLRAAAQHSQSLEAWFVHTPGLKVVVPSEPADVKGLMKASIRDDDPVMFFQHKRLFSKEGHVPADPELIIPLGRAAVKREGKDVSLLTYGSGLLPLHGRRTGTGQGGDRGRGGGSAHLEAARHGDHRRLRQENLSRGDRARGLPDRRLRRRARGAHPGRAL